MSDKQVAGLIIVIALIAGLTGATMQSMWDNHRLKDHIVILKEKGCI